MIDFSRLAEQLRTRRPAIQRWIRGCFPALTAAQIDDTLRAFESELTEKWLAPIVPLDLPWAERTPAKIFQALSTDTLRERAQFLSSRTDAPSIAAREWFLSFAAGKPKWVLAPDFFAALPANSIGDPDLRIPRGTIPEPLGRDISLYDDNETEVGRDPAEFALNSFLPGGFKIRFQNHLWAAPWEPSTGWIAPTGTNLSQAVLRVAEPNRPRPEGIPDLIAREQRAPVFSYLARETDLEQDRQRELLTELGNDSDIVIVGGLRLRDLGRPIVRRFTLDSTNAVRLSAQTAVGQTIVLTRDPHLTAQKVIIPLRAQQMEASRSIPPFQTIRFYRQQRFLALYLANLVHCYPSGGGERTVAVHFRASDAPTRPLVPAVLMRTEAIELTPDTSLNPNLSKPMRGRAFWHRVHEDLAAELVVRRAVVDSFYLIDGCVEALSALETKAADFADSPPQAEDLQTLFNSERAWRITYCR